MRSKKLSPYCKKTSRKEIALIVGCSQSTLCRELKRNSMAQGNYLRKKAHARALERRKRTTDNGSEFAAHLDIATGLRIKGLDDVTVLLMAERRCRKRQQANSSIHSPKVKFQ